MTLSPRADSRAVKLGPMARPQGKKISIHLLRQEESLRGGRNDKYSSRGDWNILFHSTNRCMWSTTVN